MNIIRRIVRVFVELDRWAEEREADCQCINEAIERSRSLDSEIKRGWLSIKEAREKEKDDSVRIQT